MQLAREAMSASEAEDRRPAEPTDLGQALAQQFALIDRNMDAVVRTLNAHNAKLERALRRQRYWNYGLGAALLVAVIVEVVVRTT
jgi:hypothetical protein